MILYDQIVQHIPLILRGKPRFTAFVRALITPLQSVVNWYESYVIDTRNILKYNGQVLYLERALNDKFDPIQRRIYIDDSIVTGINPAAIYRKSEGQPSIVLRRKNEGVNSVPLYRKSEISIYDFTVFVPVSIVDSIGQIPIKSIVDFYKIISKRYLIETF